METLKISCRKCGQSTEFPLTTAPWIVPEQQVLDKVGPESTTAKYVLNYYGYRSFCTKCYDKIIDDVNASYNDRHQLKRINAELRQEIQALKESR